MAFAPINGPWGTHFADAGKADDWARESIRRLAAFGEAKEWPEQRSTLFDAWQAIANAYKAANIPPSSDPSYRQIFRDWYGECRTPEEYARSYKIGPLVSQGGGRVASIVMEIWRIVKGAPDQCASYTAVRLSLSSEANIATTCLDPTGTGDCDYRGLFTGAASQNADGIYREHPSDRGYNASTFEWHDPPLSAGCRITRCSPPLNVSADVLHNLLDAWAGRGGVMGVIDSTRTFVMATNLMNASTLDQDLDTYLQSSRTAVLDAVQMGVGQNPTRATIAAVSAAVAAACANVPVYGWICSLAAAAVGAAAEIIPVAVGVPTDSFGVPKASDRATAPWLPTMIRIPVQTGTGMRVPLDVPDAPQSSQSALMGGGRIETPTGTPGPSPLAPTQLAPSATRQLANANRPTLELLGPDGRPIGDNTNATSTSPSPLLLLGVAGALYYFATKGR